MSKTPAEIQADIELQREQFARTVDEITNKLDVKAQTKAKVYDVRDRSTTDAGKPRPAALAAAAALVAGAVLIIWLKRR